MEIQHISSITHNNQLKNNTFKGYSPLLTSTFAAINRNEIIGVSAIDLASMVIPRSVIDFSTRGKEAGIETAIRESSSTATHAAIGLAGAGAAMLLSQGLKSKNYGVDFKSIVASNDTIESLGSVFQNIVKENPNATKEELINKFLNSAFEDVKGLAGNTDNNDKQIWYSLGNTKDKIISTLKDEIQTNNSFKLKPKTLDNLEALMNIDIPSTQKLQVNFSSLKNADVNSAVAQATKSVLDTKGTFYLSDVYALAKSFVQDNVLNIFKENNASNNFLNDLKKINSHKTVLGLAAICSFALSTQAINRYLTKKRTGKDGFVGDPNYNKQSTNDTPKAKAKDNWFLPLKALAMAGMGFFIYKTINPKDFSDFAKKMQFKGNLPTFDQIKLVYGSTILGRLFASSDNNELRESCFRDFLGYTNFLVIGNLITKWFINYKDKSLINYEQTANKSGFAKIMDWLKNSSVKTHQEVINNNLKFENGIKSMREIKAENLIPNGSSIAKKLSVLNQAKMIGMLYSCIALGIVVPLINKYMTDRKNKVNSANNSVQIQPTQVVNIEFEGKKKELINHFFKENTIV